MPAGVKRKRLRWLEKLSGSQLASTPSQPSSGKAYASVVKGYFKLDWTFQPHLRNTLLQPLAKLISTNLYLSREFPSLSNNSQLPSANQSSMWSTGNPGSRNLSGNVPRNQNTPGAQHAGGQDDMFTQASSRMPSGQGSFRFSNQGGMQPSSQAPPSSTVDDFPPLNKSANGEIGSERGQTLMASLGFSPQGNGAESAAPSSRGNGLLNALSATSRQKEARAPLGKFGPNFARILHNKR